MDEFDLMVSGYCKEATAVSMQLELNLESDSRYQQATKKLQENLAKISPAKSGASAGTGKFQYKVPKATSMLAALDVPLKKPVNLNETPTNTDNDPFETKHDKPSSSTPIASSGFVFKQKCSTQASNPCKLTPSRTTDDAKVSIQATASSSGTSASASTQNNPSHRHNSSVNKVLHARTNGNVSTDFERSLSPARNNPKVTFDPDLDDYMVEVLNGPCFKSSQLSQLSLKANRHSLQEIQKSLLEKYFDILSQLPIDFFNSVDGFRTDTYSKLKSLIESVRGKIKVNEMAAENIKASCLIGSRKSRIQTTSTKNDISAESNEASFNTSGFDQEFDESHKDYVDSTPPPVPSSSTASQSSVFVFKKPVFGTTPNTSVVADTADTANPPQHDEDEEDIESILNNIHEAELIDRGRANQTDLSAVDLITPESSFRRPEPRVTFNAAETSLRNTQFIENVETQLDEDGWQVYDASQFEDHNEVFSIADVSEALPSTSYNQRNAPKNDASLCRFLDGGNNQVRIAN